jgi:hypothetical protein
MSDERFDRDLRAVLDEDAPRAVPDDLRRRVAAIPTAHPVAPIPNASIWRRPIPLGIGVLAAAAIVIAVGVSRLGPSQNQGVGGTPGATAPSAALPSATAPSSTQPRSTAPSSNAPSRATESPSAPVVVAACKGSDLSGRILDWQGAAGSRIADVEITNTSGPRCTVRGTPGLQLIDARGRVLIDSATAGASGRPHVASGDPSFELAPGGKLHTQVLASNYCGATPKLPVSISFKLPSGEGSFRATPGAGVSSDEAVPPCMGSTGPQLTMNGWRR